MLERTAAASALGAAGVSALSGGGAAQQCDVLVDDDGGSDVDHTTIQGAIDDASAGDTICVAGGTYPEQVEVDRAVTLVGTGDPGGSDAAVVDGFVEVSADGATVRGLRVAPTTTYTPSNWTRAGSPFGILVTGNDVLVAGNVLDGMRADASTQAFFSMNGIQVFHGGSSRLTGVTIRDNVVRDMHTRGTASNYGGAAAIKVQGVLAGTDVRGNTVERVHSAGWTYGVVTTDTANAPGVSPADTTVERNTVEEVNDGSVYDVFDDESSAPFPGNAFAVDGESNASEVAVSLNDFLRTPIGAQNKDDAHTLDAECNYWGHATGPDTDDNENGKGASTLGDVDYTPWNTRKIGRGKQPERSCVGGKDSGRGRGNR